MDTRKTLLLKNIDSFPDFIKLSDVTEENRKFIEGYVSFGEHLQDVHQLFKLVINFVSSAKTLIEALESFYETFTVVVYEIYYVFLQIIEDDVKEIFDKELSIVYVRDR